MPKIKNLAENVCMLCDAYGPDRITLFINCFYEMQEIVPEMFRISHDDNVLLERGYGIMLCKTCRSELLGALKFWADTRRGVRRLPKTSDGLLLQPYVGEWKRE